MEKQIDFTTAKLLKDLHYKSECLWHWGFYDGRWSLGCRATERNWNKLHKKYVYYSAPYQSVVQEWLRKRDIHISVGSNNIEQFFVWVDVIKPNCIKSVSPEFKYFKTYEDALEHGLQESLKMLINKNNMENNEEVKNKPTVDEMVELAISVIKPQFEKGLNLKMSQHYGTRRDYSQPNSNMVVSYEHSGEKAFVIYLTNSPIVDNIMKGVYDAIQKALRQE